MSDNLRDSLYSKERLDEIVGMLKHSQAPMDVLGVVVEIGIPQGAIMIAGYANGDARLIRSAGGGLLGDLYQFTNIAEAARKLCATAQALIDKYQFPSEMILPPLPDTDNVHITVLTAGGHYGSETSGPQIIQSAHPLQPTFNSANELFDQLQALQDSANKKQANS